MSTAAASAAHAYTAHTAAGWVFLLQLVALSVSSYPLGVGL